MDRKKAGKKPKVGAHEGPPLATCVWIPLWLQACFVVFIALKLLLLGCSAGAEASGTGTGTSSGWWH
jgi:hypothetical protein